MSLSMMTGCGGNNVEAAGNDPIAQTEESHYDEQEVAQPSDVPPVDTADIGEEKVKEIVLAKVPGAVESSIFELEKEYDDGRLEYEGSLYHDGYEYEFEIDGATGQILQWEIDD